MSKKAQTGIRRQGFRIGAAAKKAGVSRQTLQYYLMLDLVSPSSRSQAGQRLFDSQAIDRIKLVRRLNRSGYTLRAIREIFLSGKVSASKKI